MRTCTWIIVLFAAAVIGCFGVAASASASSGKPTCTIDENGNCMDPYSDPVPAYTTVETGEDSSYTAFAYGQYFYKCKVVHAIRTVRNIYWVTLFQYVEQVRWCYDGNAVREFTRWRWPQAMTFGMWSFDKDIESSCVSEYCTEQIGHYFEHAKTVGQFSPNWCPFNLCASRHPSVDIGVSAYGGWGASTDG